MQGVAPDAQILTMKVFGNYGGAYESDYMAAIEDAIVLGSRRGEPIPRLCRSRHEPFHQ